MMTMFQKWLVWFFSEKTKEETLGWHHRGTSNYSTGESVSSDEVQHRSQGGPSRVSVGHSEQSQDTHRQIRAPWPSTGSAEPGGIQKRGITGVCSFRGLCLEAFPHLQQLLLLLVLNQPVSATLNLNTTITKYTLTVHILYICVQHTWMVTHSESPSMHPSPLVTADKVTCFEGTVERGGSGKLGWACMSWCMMSLIRPMLTPTHACQCRLSRRKGHPPPIPALFS